MNEQELFELMASRADINWEIFQFWSGVTFAYMAVGHFAAKGINWLVVIVLSILYISLTVAVYQMASTNMAVLAGFTQELQTMAESTELSEASTAWLAKSTGSSQIAISIATMGTFVSALIYLPYNHYRANRNAT